MKVNIYLCKVGVNFFRLLMCFIVMNDNIDCIIGMIGFRVMFWLLFFNLL